MIRSRDLVIFVVVLFVLCVAIAVTLFVKSEAFHIQEDGKVVFGAAENASTSFTALGDEKRTTTEDAIARLRKLLATNDTGIVPAPSVESPSSVSEPITPVTENSVLSLVQCGGADDALMYIQLWPQNNVSLQVRDGMRFVEHTVVTTLPAQENTASTSASSSQSVVSTTLLKMRAYPVVQGTQACVGSDIVGVTPEGRLLSNHAVAKYLQNGPDTLVGYARDGFPIYGVYEGQTDACGGYHHPQGYRYTLSTKREYMLGCYVSAPSYFEGL